MRSCLLGGLLVAACSGCASVGSGPHGGQVAYRGYGGTAIVSADGRTITVGPYLGDCPAKVTPAARESATGVALYLEYATPPNPPSCAHAMAAIVDARDIRLREPLGNRKLTDGVTGQ